MRIDWTPEQVQRLIDIEGDCCISAGITPQGVLGEIIAGNMTEEEGARLLESAGWVRVEPRDNLVVAAQPVE